ncbi:MAG: hypothetical protein KDE08_07885 [Rhodobacteraceae bacterium]|nr:hypothetical protein [Paracoccaceae bacterium]
MRRRQSLAYVIDPRFPGGTSSAVAQELRVTARKADVSIHAAASRMFSGTEIAPQLKDVLVDLGLTVNWNSRTIAADTVIIHNPSFLKFEKIWDVRIIARNLIVVAHENFLRPGEVEAFDVGRCLGLIDRASLSLAKTIAPISPHNRQGVTRWLASHGAGPWRIAAEDWFNICAFPIEPPVERPRDRRGRHSRPGFEKFPSLADMDLCFPDHAESNVILGGDTFLGGDTHRPHWSLHPFRAIDVAEFFGMIDFMVYFTAPTWRESFGRVLAEAIAAGKVVISDAGTAATFSDAVVAATPAEVDGIVAAFITDPASYRRHVRKAQSRLKDFAPDAFERMFERLVATGLGAAA